LALEMAILNPLALKEPVGFFPSSFSARDFKPYLLARFFRVKIGVKPSPRLTIFCSDSTGSSSLYLHMLPSRCASSSFLNDVPNSYLATRGLEQQGDNVCGSKAEYDVPQEEHSRLLIYDCVSMVVFMSEVELVKQVANPP
jgi:hypothetical protein